MNTLVLDRICKTFARGFLARKQPVLHDLSLTIGQGEVFGLLGHNGAGKTTTMRIILGLLRANSGTVQLMGKPASLPSARRSIGFLGDELGLYPFLNADESLTLAGQLFRMRGADIRKRSEELLELVGLDDRRKLRVAKYSKGMRQRLGIAVALINDPDFIVLDEPYSGLDPIGRRELRQLLLSLKGRGKTILMSSHIVPDVEAVCDRVGILSGGRIKHCLDIKEIYRQKTAPVEITVTGVDHRTFEGISPKIQLVYDHPEAIVVRTEDPGLVKSVISKTYAFGGDVLEIKPLKFGLEDYLMKTMNEDIDVPASDDGAPKMSKERGPEYAHSR